MAGVWLIGQIGLMRRMGLRICGFHCKTKVRIRYQMLVSDADSSGLDD
jgi:hypothetical protein